MNESRSVSASSDCILDRVLDMQQQIADSFVVKPSDEIQYYGWFSVELQALRVGNPTDHKLRMNNGKIKTLTSPPYTYWFQGDKKVLVTDITNTDEVIKRHKTTNSIFLGKLDKFCCRSYHKM
jgi:hypothetical protein